MPRPTFVAMGGRGVFTAVQGGPRGVSRRSFLKYAAIGGLAAFGAYSGLAYPSGWQKWLAYGRKPWEIDVGVVDYEIVKAKVWGPRELGFDHDIKDSPPEQRILNVAQWYDYWPGIVLDRFAPWMSQKWGVDGVEIKWQSNIYTSNEELFTWVSQTGRKFDLMYPTNYTVETLEKAGLIVNLNKDWIPNYVNTFGKVPNPVPPPHPEYKYIQNYPVFSDGYNNPADVDFRDPNLTGYSYRMNRTKYRNPRGTDQITWNEQNSLLAVPYQWGTTGIGYRTDVFDPADVERMGWEVLELPTYTNPKTGKTYDLRRKKMMLDDMREVFTAALKAVGWKRQDEFKGQVVTDALGVDHVVTADPTPIPENTGPTSPAGSWPDTYAMGPFSGEYQWSNNETAEDKLQASLNWLNSFRGSSWGFNTPQQGPWLVSGVMNVDHAWSGDIMYAVQPNSQSFNPVDYFVPKQGGARWIDNNVIHRECEKLWLAHEFINYISDPESQAAISSWNLYATPNAWAFQILHDDPTYVYEGYYPDPYPRDPSLAGKKYTYNQAEDHRIYSDIAIGYKGSPDYKPILEKCEYQGDVGVRDTLRYFQYWRQAKF
ncbi:MAG: extracellular solute-binding protein [Thermoplasmata archaeon]